MKKQGHASRAAFSLIILTLVAVGAIGVLAWFAEAVGRYVKDALPALGGLWVLFTAFTLYFFRDPEARTPAGAGLVVSPGHGKVDVIDQVDEPKFMGGRCQRISIFLSVFNVHVQNAPVSGQITYLQHTPGQFLSATRAAESAAFNENVLLGFASRETAGEKIGLRLIAGLIARRIVPFVALNDEVQRGERIRLIQFGSRCDLYLPLHYKIQAKLGDHVVGGETVLADKS